jgi:WD40 repeat protein
LVANFHQLWRYRSQDRTKNWNLLATTQYTSACITQISFLESKEGVILMTGATDGHLILWTVSNEGSISQIACTGIQNVHQNSIKSLSTMSLIDGTSLVLTSGDDNALGLTLVCMGGQSDIPLISTLIVPRAHAAAINTARFLWIRPVADNRAKYGARIVSASNDQRVKIWDVEIDLTRPGVDGVDVRRKSNQFSAVADISSMGIYPVAKGEESAHRILISGVGMEIWKVAMS